MADGSPVAATPVVGARPVEGGSALTGVLCALLANFMFASSDAIVKLLTARYSIFQIIPIQVTFACIPIAVMLVRDRGLGMMWPVNPRLVALRGLLAGLGTLFGFYAFSVLPLAQVYAIAFCTPLIVTVLSIPILGEQVGIHRWGAVVVGFIGILVMVRPGVADLTLAHLAALGSAFTGAGVVLILRRISRVEQRAVMVAAVMLGLLCASLPAGIFLFRMPPPADLALFASAGLLMGTAQFVVIQGLRLAPAASIAPMQYTMMVWALIYGALLFGNVVDPYVLCGATIVIASSLYIMHRERRRGRTLGAHVDPV